MATTLGELSRRISELRSRVAVIESLIRYTAANYLSGSGGHISAEMRFALDGGSWVPEEHILLATEELEGVVAALRIELSTLESMSIEVPEPEAEELDEAPDEPEQAEGDSDETEPSTEPEVVAATPLRKKKADVREAGTGSTDSSQPAPRQGVA